MVGHRLQCWLHASLLVLVASGCSGGGGGAHTIGTDAGTDGGAPRTPTAGKVVLAPTFVFLPGVGQSRVLTARVLDQSGASMTTPVIWNSSAPGKVSVDASGRLAAVAIGSAQIVAEAGGVRSQPVLVVVADPAPGALLVTDAQVVSVGDFIGLANGDYPDLGAQYEVRLQGVNPAPAPGTIVLASELAHVAGQVVATRTENNVLVVTLALVTLPQLVQNAAVDWDIDLADYDWSDSATTTSASAPTALKGATVDTRRAALSADIVPLEPFEPFGCTGDVSADLYSISKTVTPTVTAHLLYVAGVKDGLADGETRIEVDASLALQLLVKISLQSGIKGSISCFVQQIRVIPVGGWFSIILAPAVKVGLGLDLSAELVATLAELDLDGQAGVTFSAGVSCPADSDCITVQNWGTTESVKPSLSMNKAPALRVILDGYLFGYIGLDGVVGGGNVGDVELLKAKIGPDQTSDLAFEDTQAKDESYASNDKLKWKGGLTAGAGLAKILTKIGAKGGAAAVNQLKIPYSHDICQSPTGTFSADKLKVGVGQKVKLTMDLDPKTINYFGFDYNVASVEVWRRMQGGDTFEPLKAISMSPAIAPVTHFEGEWIPTAADLGTNTLAAFVDTKLEGEVAEEIAPSTIKQIEVLCYPPHNATSSPPVPREVSFGVAQTTGGICQDAWTGSSSSLIAGVVPIDASVKWVLDTDATRPGSGVFQYYPTGTVSVHSWVNSQGCTVRYNPSSYLLTSKADHGGVLIIDTNPDTPTYSGSGLTEWTVAVITECPDGSGGTIPVSIGGGVWFNGQGDLSADWISFAGTYDSPQYAQTFTYAFSRP